MRHEFECIGKFECYFIQDACNRSITDNFDLVFAGSHTYIANTCTSVLFVSCKCRGGGYTIYTPLHLLNEDEILDLFDKDNLLPRTNNPKLEEVIIKVSASYLFMHYSPCACCQSVCLSVCQLGDQF